MSQKDRHDDFLAQGPGYRLALSPREATFQLAKASTVSRLTSHGKKLTRGNTSLPAETLKMQLAGADPSAHAAPNANPTGHANYFLGKDPGKWRTGIPLYSRVEYRQVYQGIDLVYYGNQRQLEYDFLVRPGVDPKRIALKFAGARTVRLAANGDLVLGLKQGDLRWHRPLTYQTIAGKKHMVASSFVLKRGQEVGFAVARYDKARPLVIDPKLIYAILLGGHKSSSAAALTVDNAGNTYVAGDTGSTDFPITPGAFQNTFKVDQRDLRYQNSPTTFVAKLNPTGTALLYATYLGGSRSDTPTGIAVDAQGNAYVTGSASSADFPVTPGAFQTINLEDPDRLYENKSATAFVTKLNPTGSALVYSTFLGGHLSFNETDTTSGIAVDAQGSAYVTGHATSLDFPTTPGAFQTTVTHKDNAFITKLNPTGTALSYSTYLGGSGFAQGSAIAVDSMGAAYVAGNTYTKDFPTTPGAFEQNVTSSFLRNITFITKLNPTGVALAYSTYLGSHSDGATAYSIAVDSAGSAYVTGSEVSTGYTAGFPLTPGSFQRIKPQESTLFPIPDAFVTKFNPAGTALVYSAILGRGAGYRITVDSAGNATVAGTASDKDFPTTIGAFQRTFSASNTFVARLNTAGSALLYATYLPWDHSNPSGIAVDNQGIATVGGFTYRPGFSVTPSSIPQVTEAPPYTTFAYVARLSIHPIFPDFNADGNTDLLLKNSVTGVVGTWFLNGADVQGGTPFSRLPPITYNLIGTGDFRADGSATLVFQDSADNRVVFYYTGGLNTAVITGGDYVNQTPEAGWRLAGVADFNQDGRSDLLFQNATTGRLVIWNMNGPYLQSGVIDLPIPGADWKAVGTGDVNGDGSADIVLQSQTTGAIKIWFMQGTAYASEGALTATLAPGWSVVGVGDYDNDGRADLLLQNQTTHQAAIWYLNGTLVLGSRNLSWSMPANWNIVGPR